MRYYPIKKEFYQAFENKEKVLQELIERKSKQLDGICEYINIYDFYRRCIRFYGEEQYQLVKNTIVYTHPITKKQNICHLYTHYFELEDTLGFEKWLQRYFCYYFQVDNRNGNWFTYLKSHS